MQDSEIINLYFNRDERAITETDSKYGAYCYKIADNILGVKQDSEECVNDTWLKTWSAIPPEKPKIFSAFLAKITRNLAINRFNYENAKRRNTNAAVALDELEECVGGNDVEGTVDCKEVIRALNEFLKGLPDRERNIFIRRYFFADSTSYIAEKYSMKESNVLTVLSRTRKKLREYMKKEGLLDE